MGQRSKVGLEGSIESPLWKVAHPNGMVISVVDPGMALHSFLTDLGLCLGAGGSSETSTGPFPLVAALWGGICVGLLFLTNRVISAKPRALPWLPRWGSLAHQRPTHTRCAGPTEVVVLEPGPRT
ncbi:hypothetical protein BHE74_00057573 [Ensete ventricosum]|nr:hypothetical protein BHE74_00057573 [Ensete ventricosum]